MDFINLIGAVFSAFAVGALLPLYSDLKVARKSLEDRVKEFDEITKKACEANNSLAERVVSFDERISSLEFYRSNSGLQAPSPWKAK